MTSAPPSTFVQTKKITVACPHGRALVGTRAPAGRWFLHRLLVTGGWTTGHLRMPLTISSTACSGVSPRAIKVSNSFLSTLPMAASWVTLASG